MITRKLLVGLILSLVIGLLAACTTPAGDTGGTDGGEEPGGEDQGGDTGETQEAEEGSGEVQELNFYNWTTYMDPEIITAFEEQFNVEVNEDYYGDNDELLAKIQPGNPGYDIIVPTDYMVEIMNQQGLLMELDHDKLPNFANVDESLLDPYYDPGNAHCVPYLWGTQGLGYNEAVTGPIDSWEVMFNGEHAGRISWLTDARGVLGAALIYLGYDPNTTDEAQIQEALQLLVDTKDDVVAFAPDTGQMLLEQGEVDIAFEYSGDIFQLATANPDIKYVIPTEGSIIWTDNMCIPEGAPNPELAHEFINFILDAEIGAQLANYTQYASPNKASLPLIDEELQNDIIYPPEDSREGLTYLRSLGDADLLYEEAWTELGVSE